jgi:hypothetical protein
MQYKMTAFFNRNVVKSAKWPSQTQTGKASATTAA